MKELLKYIENGISINGNPKDGYTVFTIPTQHFKISSLEELTPDRFERAIKSFEKREKLTADLFCEAYASGLLKKPIININFQDYLSSPCPSQFHDIKLNQSGHDEI